MGTGSQRERRSASTLRFLIRDVEKRLRKLEKQHATISAELEAVDPTDHVALAECGQRLAAVDAELRAAEDEWLTLGEEAEA